MMAEMGASQFMELWEFRKQEPFPLEWQWLHWQVAYICTLLTNRWRGAGEEPVDMNEFLLMKDKPRPQTAAEMKANMEFILGTNRVRSS